MKTVLICGDRDWKNSVLIDEVISLIPKDKYDTIIHGDAKGADSLADIIGRVYGFTVIKYPADWNNHGRSAGPIRNNKMLKEGKPDLVIAFHNDLQHSKGTKHMVEIALKASNQGPKIIEIICIDESLDISKLVIE
jgi:hypothetical protein